MKWHMRTLRVVCAAGLVLVVLAFCAVQFQQRLMRWRAERLLADIRQIQMGHSTWSDAQRLMHRWGASGRWEGSCTSQRCDYQIVLQDISVIPGRV